MGGGGKTEAGGRKARRQAWYCWLEESKLTRLDGSEDMYVSPARLWHVIVPFHTLMGVWEAMPREAAAVHESVYF